MLAHVSNSLVRVTRRADWYLAILASSRGHGLKENGGIYLLQHIHTLILALPYPFSFIL